MAVRKSTKDAAIAEMSLRRLRGESLDVIADEIVMVSNAIAKMLRTKLNEDTLMLLIQASIGSGPETKYRPIPMKTIKRVIDGMMALQTTHLKQPKEK